MKLDPRVNFLAVILITTSAFIIKDIWFNVLILTASIAISITAGTRWREMRPHMGRLCTLSVLVFVIQAFFYPGGKRILVIPGTFDLFGAELSMPSWLEGVGLVSVGGMTFGLYLVLRLGIIVMMSIYFNRSTSPPHFIAGLSRMGIPHSIGLGVNIALRFIPQMTREMEDMKMAQRARGRKFSEGNVFRRVINLLALLRPMVIRYIIRTRHLSNVLNARCYFPGVKRSSFHRIRMNTFDWALLISLVSLVAMASVYRFI